MTLQAEDRVPSFYTFAVFRPGRIALLYGGVLTIASFCVVVFLFNFGIREQLWSFPTAEYGSISASPAEAPNQAADAMAAPRTLARVDLSDSTVHSLVGTYFSATANRRYTITLEGDELKLHVGTPGIDALQNVNLIPVSDHRLYAGEELSLEFTAASDGKISQIDVYDLGRHFVAVRQ